MLTFFIYPSSNGQYYFTIETGTNYKVLATSETYHNKSDCRAAAELIKGRAGTALIVDMTTASASAR